MPYFFLVILEIDPLSSQMRKEREMRVTMINWLALTIGMESLKPLELQNQSKQLSSY